jgi:glycosyltransferase involved in cell wall biosynthesis
MNLLYVLLDFPIASEQFVVREIEALRALGATIQILTIRSQRSATPRSADPFIVVPPARPSSWLFWYAAATSSVRYPRRCARLLATACSIGRREGGLGPIRAFRLALLALSLVRALQDGGPRIIHAHFASGPTTLALLLSQWLEWPFSFSVHARDLYADSVNFRVKAAYARGIFACSQSAAHELRKRLPPETRTRIHAIYHGLDVSSLGQQRPCIEDTVPVIMAVGRFEPKKGFNYLLDACGLLRDGNFAFTCDIVGAGNEEASLRSRIHLLGLQDHVRLIGWCQPQELAARYRRASALAVPSIVAPDGDRDNIPNVVLEALAHGTVVVASALPGLAEIPDFARAALLVRDRDPRALADALRKVCTDMELAQEMRDRGYGLVRREFDIRINASRMLGCFARFALGPSART